MRWATRSPIALVALVCAVLLATAAAVLWPSGSSGHAAEPPAGVPASQAGWHPVFADDFQGPAGSAPSAERWIHDVGAGTTFSTGMVQTYTDATENTFLDGRGNLVITALNTNGSWTSGRIHSVAQVAAPAGGELEVTAAVEQPAPAGGQGYWDAFWLLGPDQWPATGEIDILENVDALPTYSGTLHCGVDPGGPCDEPDGIGTGLVPCAGCESGFHTYSVLIDRRTAGQESLTWSVDGRQMLRLTQDRLPAATWQQTVEHGFSVLFDVAIGGGFPDAACRCTSPTAETSSGGSMTVAYVAAYAKGP